jgi:hypothetical protein
VIQAWHAGLIARPREDMPGFAPCRAYTATQAKRHAWLAIEAQTRRELAARHP